MIFQACASISLKNPKRTIELIAEDLAEHDAIVAKEGNFDRISFPKSHAYLRAENDTLSVRAEANDISELHFMKMVMAAHVIEHGGQPAPEIVWVGDAAETIPPYFRFVKVVKVEAVTPLMRRVRVTGEDLERYFTEENLHIVLVIPPAGVAEPAWPRIGANGLVEWPDNSNRPATRHYTIRSYDRKNQTIDIDFVIHADSGPGSTWANNVEIGQVLGIAGPLGLGVRAADWYLLAGDETALPAIARILENLPENAEGTALIEIASLAEKQVLKKPDAMNIQWLCRDDEAAGTTDLLFSAVQQIVLPVDTRSIFVWAGCEFKAFKSIRSYLRKECELKKEQHLVVSYWRKGKTEDELSNE